MDSLNAAQLVNWTSASAASSASRMAAIVQSRARVWSDANAQPFSFSAPNQQGNVPPFPSLPGAAHDHAPTRHVALSDASDEIRAKLVAANANDVVVMVTAAHRAVLVALIAALEERDGVSGRRQYASMVELLGHVPGMVDLVVSDPALLAAFVYSRGRQTFKSLWPVRALLWGTSEHTARATSARDERRRIEEVLVAAVSGDYMATVARQPKPRLDNGATLRSAFVVAWADARSTEPTGFWLCLGTRTSTMYSGVGWRCFERGRVVVTGLDSAAVAKWFPHARTVALGVS